MHAGCVKHFVWVKIKEANTKVLAYFPEGVSIPYVMSDTYKLMGYEINRDKAILDSRIINGEDIDGFLLYPLRDYDWELV